VSDELAIATTTATLQFILGKAVPTVTLVPPDQAAKGGGDRINLFLYQTALDPAWRNQEIPGRVKPGEAALPPLPLNLYYLVTAYSHDGGDLLSHQLLGQAMLALFDHPVLGPADIQGKLPKSDLENQVERVRITPISLTTEENSKLWTAFQTPYRLSVAYLVSVVLIDSRRSVRAPLPVLSRGEGDRGAAVVSGGLPLLAAVRPVAKLPAVRLGEDLSLTGENLAGGAIQVVFQGPRGTGPFSPKSLKKVTGGEIVAELPGVAVRSTWPAGIYTAQVIASRAGEPDRSSGELPFPLAPTITLSALAGPNLTLTVNSIPDVQPEQRVSLLVGEREVPPTAHPTPDTLEFDLLGLPKGTSVVRLRVDGVDSIPIDLTGPTPQFAADQMVTIP
jgi:hypothetical protein